MSYALRDEAVCCTRAGCSQQKEGSLPLRELT